MDIKQLTYFSSVVNEGTVTAAAKALNMSQPPLSKQIQLLEQELGCPLFDRKARHMYLTDAGRILYERTCNILDMCASAKSEISDLKTGLAGTLRLGVVTSICNTVFQKWMECFCSKHVNMKFDLYEGNTYQLLDKVRSNQVELAFIRTPFNAPDLLCVFLQSEPLCAVGQPKFFSGLENTIQLSQLASVPLLLYRRWEQILRDAFQNLCLYPRIFCISDDARTIVSMARSGFGVGIVPKSAINEQPGAEIISRTIGCPQFHSDICAVYRKDMYISSAVKQFLDDVRAHLGTE